MEVGVRPFLYLPPCDLYTLPLFPLFHFRRHCSRTLRVLDRRASSWSAFVEAIMGLLPTRSQTFAPILRSRAFLVPFAVVLILFTIIYAPLPAIYDVHRDAVLGGIAVVAKGHLSPTPPPVWHPLSLEHVHSKYAFASFLAGEADTDENADTVLPMTNILLLRDCSHTRFCMRRRHGREKSPSHSSSSSPATCRKENAAAYVEMEQSSSRPSL